MHKSFFSFICMRRAKCSTVVIVVAAISAGMYLLHIGEIITLHATGTTIVYANSINQDLAYTLAEGEQAHVLSCEDTKSDLLIRVRLKNGVTGYVSSGSYFLERHRINPYLLFSKYDKITFDCKGLFESRRGTLTSYKTGTEARGELRRQYA